MTLALLSLAIVLLFCLMAGMIRIAAGPTAADRMLAAQLIGTAGVGALVLLGQGLSRPALFDVALVFALLAAVAAVAFVQCHATDARGQQQ